LQRETTGGGGPSSIKTVTTDWETMIWLILFSLLPSKLIIFT
jgi:hypothetical protein